MGDRKQKYIKKAIDLNNKRYAASQHSSFFGGLITGQHAKDSFYLENGDKDKHFGRVPAEQQVDQQDLTKEENAGQLEDVGQPHNPDGKEEAQE